MPAPLRIDFAGNGQTIAWGARALLLGGGLAALGAVFAFQELHAELGRVEAQVRASARQVAVAVGPAQADPSATRALSARIVASNRVLDALDQPWTRLFQDIESAAIDGIALLALEPDATQGSIRLSGEAQDLETLSRYLQRLGALASLRDVRIAQHELRESSAQLVLRFMVVGRWVRAT